LVDWAIRQIGNWVIGDKEGNDEPASG